MPSIWNPFKKEETKVPDGNSQSKSEADSLVERMTAAMDERLNERLKPLSEKVEKFSTFLTKVEEETGRSNEPDPATLTDEEKATKEKTALFALTVQANARITENDCILGIQREWPQLVAPVREYFKNTPWQRKANPDYPDYCGNIIDMMVGKEARKSGFHYDQNTKTFFLEDATSKGGDDSENPLNDRSLAWSDPFKTEKTLTAKQQLAKLGINPEDFAKSMKSGAV